MGNPPALNVNTVTPVNINSSWWIPQHNHLDARPPARAGSHGIAWTDTWSNSALLIVILKHIYKPDRCYLSPVVPNQVISVQIQRRPCVWGAQGRQKSGPCWGVMQVLCEMSAGCKAGSWHCVLAEAAVGLSAYTQLACMMWCWGLGPCKLTLTSHRHDKG